MKQPGIIFVVARFPWQQLQRGTAMTATTTAPLDLIARPTTPLALGSAFRKLALPGLAAFVATWGLMTLPETLAMDGRIALVVTVLALIGWVGTKLPESVVALCAALVLVLTGAMPEDKLYAALGSNLVWLLLAAFLIAAVIKDSGLADRMVAPLTARRPRFVMLVAMTAALTAGTAFVLPSTSGRAALLLPVFLALLPLLPDARLGRALSLLFPTVILLSAGGSLIGAGAHLVAVEAIAATGGPKIGYLDWLMLGAPLAALASAAGAVLILVLFAPRDLWMARLRTAETAGPMNVQQKRIILIILGLVGLWLTEALHGLGMALVAVVGAVILLTPPFTSKKTKELFRGVDMELILYMAATMMIAQSMTSTGADRWLADQALTVLPAAVMQNGFAIAVLLSITAVLAHLAIASRSARAAVLIPAIALPLAGMGHDATLMVLIAVMGTGFCQTLMASAKPVAIFGTREEAGFTQADLFRLAMPLGFAKIVLLVIFATIIWPAQLADTQTAPTVAVEAAADVAVAVEQGDPQLTAEFEITTVPPIGDRQLQPTTFDEAAKHAVGRVAQALAARKDEAAVLATTETNLRAAPRVLTPAPESTAALPRQTRSSQAPSLGAQIERDLRAAGRQISRDLRALF
jgi:solute carrier family 13 (sodium-dependent dicarboxylate transporter), member 2/3/5